MTTSSALALAAACVLLGACSSSSTSTHETSDAATDSHSDHDAAKNDAAVVADAGVDAPPQPVFSADAGVTWTALYRDYFGNESAVHTAGCANGNYCHATTTQDGYEASAYLCPKDDKEACYKSLTSQDAGGPQLVAPDAGWEDDYLSSVLCQVDEKGQMTGDGTMPYGCAYNFTPTDIARIKAWIAAGYPDN